MFKPILLLLLIGCFACNSECTDASTWEKTELYFGMTRNGQDIPEEDWENFRSQTLAKDFSGFTVVPATGFWTNDAGKELFEKSKMVIYLHPISTKEDSLIEHVIEVYKDQFQQESVLRVDVDATVKF